MKIYIDIKSGKYPNDQEATLAISKHSHEILQFVITGKAYLVDKSELIRAVNAFKEEY